LKFNPIRISSRSTRILGDIKAKTGLTPNILLRIAICISIKQQSIPNPDEFNADGSELTPIVLFGEHEPIYHALMINRLKQDKLDALPNFSVKYGFISSNTRESTGVVA